jgi:hypothetical protein
LICMKVFSSSRLNIVFEYKSFSSFHSFPTHFPIPLHGWILYKLKKIPYLVLLSDDVGIIFSIFIGVSLDFIYGNK